MRLLAICLGLTGLLSGATSGCEALIRGLAAATQDARDRAALAAWRECDRRQLVTIRDAGRLLASAAAADHGTAAAIILLGYFPGKAARAVLGGLDPGARTKLHPWDPVVRQSVARDVALLLMGDAKARKALQSALSDTSAAVFVFRAVRDVRDTELLASLARLLDDERPAGVGGEGEPEMRVCDVALESLVRRFDLKPPFRLQTRRYDDAERRLVAGLLPR